MKGQIITGIYGATKNQEWAMIQTNQGCYELRLGSVLPTEEERSQDQLLDFDVNGKTISALMTDDFALFFELEDGSCLVHTEMEEETDGSFNFQIFHLTPTQFEDAKKQWYGKDEELRSID